MVRPRIDPAKAVADWNAGAMIKDIAKDQGVSEGTVSRHLRAAGIDTRSRWGQNQKRAPHGSPARWMRGCRCEVCKPAMQEYKREEHERLKESADLSQYEHPSSRAYLAGCRCEPCKTRQREILRERQSKSATNAKKAGKAWTGPEVEYALRDDIPLTQIAKDLGRTYAAVSNVRRAVADPSSESHHRYMTLLGKDYWG